MLTRSGSGFLRALERVEASLGVMMSGVLTGVLGLASIGLLAAAIYKPRDFQSTSAIMLIVGLLVTTILTAMMFGRLVNAFEKNSPHATYDMSRAFARRSFVSRIILGPLALLTALGVIALGRFWTMLFERPGRITLFGHVVILSLTFVIVLGAAYATNGYLLCFLRAWGFPRWLVKFVYRNRYILDAVIAVALTFAFDPFNAR